LPKAFSDSYPFRAITFRALAQGNMKNIRLSRLTADLPGAFSFSSTADLKNLSNKQNRSGRIDFRLATKDLGFLAALINKSSNGTIHVPQDMNLQGKVEMKGLRYLAGLTLNEGEGEVKADVEYNGARNSYNAKATINKLQVNHFLPKDSIYSLTASFQAAGEGTDIFSPKTKLIGGIELQELRYGKSFVTGLSLQANLEKSLMKATLSSKSDLLQMEGNLTAQLQKKLTKADLSMNVRHIDLKRLGFIPRSLRKPTPFMLIASTDKESTSFELHSGDLALSLKSTAPLETFIKEMTTFSSLLGKQIQKKRLNQQELREAMPSVRLVFTAGKRNPLSEYLALS
jgi:hypothetical protein